MARHRDDLPTSLDELSLLPMPFRKVIVRAVSPDVRVALWRAHLATFLAPSHEWSYEQRCLLEEAIAAMPLLVGDYSQDSRARARVLEARLRRVFTASQHFVMFGMLGPPEPPGGRPIPADAWSPHAG